MPYRLRADRMMLDPTGAHAWFASIDGERK
jgi:hypothetical protein